MATQTLNPPQNIVPAQVQAKLEDVRKATQEHEDRILAIKKFVGQPIDFNNPIPLFKQLGQTKS